MKDSEERREHASQLQLERHLRGELEGEELEWCREPLERCHECAAQLDAMRAFDDAFRAQMPALDLDGLLGAAPEPAPSPEPPRREESLRREPPITHAPSPRKSIWASPRFGRIAGALAMVFVGFIGIYALIREPANTDTSIDPNDGVSQHRDPLLDRDIIRRKSSALRWDVYVHDGRRARLALDGEVVHPGDRLGFQVAAADGGHLLIAGVDERKNVYLGFPQDGEGRAEEIASSKEPIELDDALRLDDVLGKEKLVAFLCDRPIAFDEIKPLLERGAELEGAINHCRVRVITLEKRALDAREQAPLPENE